MAIKKDYNMKSKKIVSFVILMALVAASVCIVAACTDSSSDTPTVTSITAILADDVSYTVGDAFDTEDVTVTATMSDGTERTVETVAALEFALEALKLNDEGEFTEAGEYTLNVSFAGHAASVTFTVAEA